jgi:hypothetical protein
MVVPATRDLDLVAQGCHDKRALSPSHRRRTPVERYHELSAEITEYRRAPWTAIAAEIAKAGIRDAKGQAPSPKAVRDAFLRVKEAMEMRAAMEPNGPHPKRQSPPSAAVTLTTTESSGQEEDEERPRYKFEPSKPKDWTKP